MKQQLRIQAVDAETAVDMVRRLMESEGRVVASLRVEPLGPPAVWRADVVAFEIPAMRAAA